MYIPEISDLASALLAIQTYDEVKARQEEKQEQIATLTNERKQILEKMSGYEQIKKEYPELSASDDVKAKRAEDEAAVRQFAKINDEFREVWY